MAMTKEHNITQLALQLANQNITTLLSNLSDAAVKIEELSIKLAESDKQLAEANAKLDRAPEPASSQ